MATAVQFRRGNTQQTSAFTGAVGEVTVDTDKDVVVVHDGSTAGGFAAARESALITVRDNANSAFAKANAANSLAQEAYNKANTGTENGQGGFDQANAANILAQAAFNKANAALANTDGAIFNGNLIVSTSLTTGNISANNLLITNSGIITGADSITGNSIIDGTKRVVTSFLNTAPILVTKTSTENTVTITHATSGVNSGTYGSSTKAAVIQVDSKGHVTEASEVLLQYATVDSNGVVQLEDSIASSNTDRASTPNSVKLAYDHANSAFLTANTANTTAEAAFSKANSANVLAQTGFDKANSANIIAQAAFDKANAAVMKAGDIVPGSLNVTNTTVSTSKDTGAIIIAGGLGVSDNIYANAVYANAIFEDGQRLTTRFSNTDPILITKEADSNTVSISHNTSGVTATTYGDSINTVTIVVNTTGHVTNVINTTIRSGTTSQTGVVQLEDSLTSTSTTKAATPNSVKLAYDHANSAYSVANAANTLANSLLPLTGGVISGNLEVQGNLIVSGNVTQISANNLSIEDNMIYLNEGANANAYPDLGIVAAYDDGTYQHTGIFRDATDGYWTVFDNYTLEPSDSIFIDTSHASYRIGNFRANIATDVITVRGVDPLDRANTAQTTAEAAFSAANNKVLKAGDTMTGVLNIANATPATSKTTGALIVGGGVGVSGNVYADGFIYDSGSRVITVSNQSQLIEAAGSNGQIQFNTNDKLDASANLVFANNGLFVGTYSVEPGYNFDAGGIVTASREFRFGNWTDEGDTWGRMRMATASQSSDFYGFRASSAGIADPNAALVITNEELNFQQAIVLIDSSPYYGAEGTLFGVSAQADTGLLLPSTGAENTWNKMFEVTTTGNVKVGGSIVISPTFQPLDVRADNDEVGIKFADGSFQYTAETPLAVKEEGTTIVSRTRSLDFVGSAVTASNTGNAVTITINSIPASGGTFTGPVIGNTITSNVITSNSVVIQTASIIEGFAYTTSTLSTVAVDSWDADEYRCLKYFARVSCNATNEHMFIEVNMVHDGANVFVSQFGEVKTGATLGSFGGVITPGTPGVTPNVISLLFNPTNANTRISGARVLLYNSF